MRCFAIVPLLVLMMQPAWLLGMPADSLQTRQYDLNEVVVTAPRETGRLRDLPAALSMITGRTTEGLQMQAIKGLSSYVPNLFIPDYGSKITSAIYLRGIGSRMNAPTVGLYVDNMPYLDKSTFDFDFLDIERIEVLRGPQGTLYGRNSLAGLINIQTRSPFDYQGSRITLSAGTRNTLGASFSTYQKASETMAFSLGGRYEYEGGFFTNQYTGKKADQLYSGSLHGKFLWKMSPSWQLTYTVNYENSDQGGYAYGKVDKESGWVADVNYNQPSTYQRSLLSNGLYLEYKGPKLIVSSLTSHQYFSDRMFLDQDFSPLSIYTLNQNQSQNAYSQEFVFKSNSNSRLQWVSGAYGFVQHLKTRPPVVFGSDGIETMIQSVFDRLHEENPNMPVATVESDQMVINGHYTTPSRGVALYHQSTLRDLFTDGLSLTAGIRFDYEKASLRHNTFSPGLEYTLALGGGRIIVPFKDSDIAISGEEERHFTQWIPKLALRYEISDRQSIYTSVAKGYKAGGFNIQMFSDLVQGMMIQRSTTPDPDDAPADIKALLSYEPEYSWNYEVGGRSEWIPNRMFSEITLFYIDVRNQQIARFSPGGFGRMMANAGHSVSKGVEFSLRTRTLYGLWSSFNWGYTHATFKEYNDNKNDYSGNWVPLAPRHTYSAGLDYTWQAESKIADRILFFVQYAGVGRMFWTEQNDVSQAGYGILNGKVSWVKEPVQIDFWVRNALNKRYETFYFASMGQGFLQKGNPIHAGMNVTVQF